MVQAMLLYGFSMTLHHYDVQRAVHFKMKTCEVKAFFEKIEGYPYDEMKQKVEEYPYKEMHNKCFFETPHSYDWYSHTYLTWLFLGNQALQIINLYVMNYQIKS